MIKIEPFQFSELYGMAVCAGREAAKQTRPTPMVVYTPIGLSRDVDHSKPVYHVPDGTCGFAWVKIAGNTAFGRWAKKTGRASKSYSGGLQFWISEHGQSMELKEAHANAFAKVLEAHGIEAFAQSRMD